MKTYGLLPVFLVIVYLNINDTAYGQTDRNDIGIDMMNDSCTPAVFQIHQDNNVSAFNLTDPGSKDQIASKTIAMRAVPNDKVQVVDYDISLSKLNSNKIDLMYNATEYVVGIAKVRFNKKSGLHDASEYVKTVLIDGSWHLILNDSIKESITVGAKLQVSLIIYDKAYYLSLGPATTRSVSGAVTDVQYFK